MLSVTDLDFDTAANYRNRFQEQGINVVTDFAVRPALFPIIPLIEPSFRRNFQFVVYEIEMLECEQEQVLIVFN